MTKRQPLPEYLARRLRKDGYAALYVAGPDQVVFTRPAQNRGSRPLKIGVTTAWADTITNNLDSSSPFYWQGVLFRLWCSSVDKARMLESLVAGHLKDHSDPLRKSWADLGPDLDTKQFENAIRKLGKEYNVATWTDAELVAKLKDLESKPARIIKRMFA